MRGFVPVLLYFGASVWATDPGFEARITQKGFTYANQVAVKSLSAMIRGQHIPGQSGRSGDVRYTVSNMDITNFNDPTSSMTLATGSGIRWSMSGADLSMHGDFSYSFKKGFIKISDHGSFDVTLSSLSISLSINVGASQGRPKVTATGCQSNIGAVSIQFHGGAAWIYNLFKGLLENQIKSLLDGKMCDIADEAINVNANTQLAKLPMTVVIAQKFLLDYGLLTSPTFTSQYLQTKHKGEVYWKGDKAETPFSPHPIDTGADTSRMLYLWISDYMGNSLAYTGYKHGFLQYNLTAQDLPPANRSVLNTTCTSFLCVGSIIPQIGKKYPNTKVMMSMYATKSPVVNITNGAVMMNFSGNVDLYAQLPKKPQFLLTIVCAFGIKANVSVQGQLVKGHISQTSLQVVVKNSQVGSVSSAMLQSVMKFALDGFIVPELNAEGNKGLILPVTPDIRFTNTKLTLIKDALVVATDLKYLSDDQLTRMTEPTVQKNPALSRVLRPEMIFSVVGRARKQLYPQL